MAQLAEEVLRPAAQIVALGEAMVEFNQTRAAEPLFLRGFGGDTSNAIIAAARQGARCRYLTRVGDDDFGRLLLQLWRDEAVDTSAVAVDADAHTGVYFVSHGPAGHAFSYLRAGSAASRMRPGDFGDSAFAGARWLHVSAISQAISASACDTVFDAIERARRGGATVSYDPNLRLRLWPLQRARAVIAATVASCDLFLPSLDDAALLTGITDPDSLADWALERGAGAVAVKLGSAGCLVADRTARCRIAGHPVAAVDATGAGDCFAGAMLARLAAGAALFDAARYANAAAALTTAGFGAVAPIPTRQQVHALLDGGN
ncbi:MAG TPA: sugar kinase [Burkholderiaceae bacterium]|nr:sugar kinase [Burkholderiaceae bacterium]